MGIHNASGGVVGIVLRYDTPTTRGKRQEKTFRPLSLRQDGRWAIRAMSPPRPLYRLCHLLDVAGIVYVTEGEKAADALASIGLASTTFAGGASAVRQTDYTPLAGRTVIIVPDNDDAGEKCVKALMEQLKRLHPAPVVAVLTLPGLPEKGDAVEFIAAARQRGECDREIKGTIEPCRDVAGNGGRASANHHYPSIPHGPIHQLPKPSTVCPVGWSPRSARPAKRVTLHCWCRVWLLLVTPSGGERHFVVEGDHHHGNEYCVLVGRSSKGPRALRGGVTHSYSWRRRSNGRPGTSRPAYRVARG